MYLRLQLTLVKAMFAVALGACAVLLPLNATGLEGHSGVAGVGSYNIEQGSAKFYVHGIYVVRPEWD